MRAEKRPGAGPAGGGGQAGQHPWSQAVPSMSAARRTDAGPAPKPFVRERDSGRVGVVDSGDIDARHVSNPGGTLMGRSRLAAPVCVMATLVVTASPVRA